MSKIEVKPPQLNSAELGKFLNKNKDAVGKDICIYADQLETNENLSARHSNTEESLWTGYDNKDGTFAGAVYQQGDQTIVKVDGKSYSDDDGDGKIDRVWDNEQRF